MPGYRTYEITVNGEVILKPYIDQIQYNKSTFNKINGVEVFEFRSAEGSILARGWYANSNLLAAIPSSNAMRGIRVIHRNFTIGDEYFLQNIFTERRFAVWHIGEIYLSSELKPNARRDDFEHTSAYEKFLEQAGPLGRFLSNECRISSKMRSMRNTIDGQFRDAEEIIFRPCFIDEAHFRGEIKKAEHLVVRIEQNIEEAELEPSYSKRLVELLDAYNNLRLDPPYLAAVLDGRTLRYENSKDVILTLCRRFIASQNNGKPAEQVLYKMVSPYLRRSIIETYENNKSSQ